MKRKMKISERLERLFDWAEMMGPNRYRTDLIAEYVFAWQDFIRYYAGRPISKYYGAYRIQRRPWKSHKTCHVTAFSRPLILLFAIPIYIIYRLYEPIIWRRHLKRSEMKGQANGN